MKTNHQNLVKINFFVLYHSDEPRGSAVAAVVEMETESDNTPQQRPSDPMNDSYSDEPSDFEHLRGPYLNVRDLEPQRFHS